MNREITVRYTPEIIKFAVRQFWRRSIDAGGFAAFILMTALAIYLFVIGDRSWLLGVVGTAVLFCFVIGAASYRIYLSRSMEKFKRMNDGIAKFQFSDNGIWVESDIGASEVAWAFIEKIWVFPKVWLLFYPKQGYSTLPVADIDDELRQFIIEKVRENGGEVIRH